MWGMILSLIGGPVVTGLIDGYKAKLAATNTTDKIAADLAAKEIEAEIAARANANQIILAEQGRWWTAAPRAIVQWAFAIYIGKILFWDKVLGWGSTDPLAGDVQAWGGAIIAMWFGGRTIEKVAQILKPRG